MLLTGANRTLGIDDKAFVLVDSILVTGLGRIALMPTLVLCARICPEVCSRAFAVILLDMHVKAGGVAHPCRESVFLVREQGVEATLYAALMSVANASYNTGELLGALTTQLLGITAQVFTNLPWLVFISAMCGLLSLPFLRFIRSSYHPLPKEEPDPRREPAAQV